MSNENRDLIAQWKAEETHQMQGWDFSYLAGRYIEEEPSWSYEAIVRSLLPAAESVLDMGTGGGEKLLEFRDLLPPYTVATEGWEPNIPIAKANLEPHGIKVAEYDVAFDSRMPFEDDSFDLIINRHEAFDAVEVARILKPGGVFLTQQVDGAEHLADLAPVFGFEIPFSHVTLEKCGKQISEAGLVIDRAEEWHGHVRFADVGALVYYGHAVPWAFPADFSVERYADQLLALHRGPDLSFRDGRFMIQAHKPAA